ncbi:Capsule polysaccharide biosynthesis protein [Piscirickettsia salmonis]|uniref:capsular polysaccharide export protein, LipB/KpsS family n=1 Tax=Piscirickettsia salmonis TaxID=1238 RepID=UPI0012B9F3B4|nr:capsule biosynthesis protein [Piscirickettsia salmonis]QGP49103.1 Capsule polysaccharide biosynthesis protein [Piscirickettsia salmonis]
MKSRVLIVGLQMPIQAAAVHHVLLECGSNFEAIYHITNKPLIDKTLVNYQSLSFDSVAAMDPDDPSFSEQVKRPVDAQLLEELAVFEPTVLKLVERIFPKKRRYRYFDLRRHLYYSYLSYWSNFLKDNKIDKVIFDDVPHVGFDYVLYILSKHYGIKVIVPFQLQVVDAYLIANDIKTLFLPLKHALDALGSQSVSLNELSPRMQKEYEVRMSESSPFYMLDNRQGSIKSSILRLYRRYISLSEKEQQIRHEIVKPSFKCVHIKEVNFDRPYVYFGLHYQPEMTTNPLGGRYVDQFLAIQLISKVLPDGVKLYIKEHPAIYKERNPSGRFVEFYEKIAQLPGVSFVPQNTNSLELIKNSQAVATITGTTGWEALFMGKPVFVFGNIFYKYCQGVYPIYSYKDMQVAADAVFNRAEKPTESDILRFLKVLDQVTGNGIIRDEYFAISCNQDKVYHNKNTSLIVRKMLNM